MYINDDSIKRKTKLKSLTILYLLLLSSNLFALDGNASGNKAGKDSMMTKMSSQMIEMKSSMKKI